MIGDADIARPHFGCLSNLPRRVNCAYATGFKFCLDHIFTPVDALPVGR